MRGRYAEGLQQAAAVGTVRQNPRTVSPSARARSDQKERAPLRGSDQYGKQDGPGPQGDPRTGPQGDPRTDPRRPLIRSPLPRRSKIGVKKSPACG